jgi:hypothetical protein
MLALSLAWFLALISTLCLYTSIFIYKDFVLACGLIIEDACALGFKECIRHVYILIVHGIQLVSSESGTPVDNLPLVRLIRLIFSEVSLSPLMGSLEHVYILFGLTTTTREDGVRRERDCTYPHANHMNHLTCPYSPK